MSEKTKQMDLCINCLNVQNCYYCRSKSHPVHFCEEFTCKEPGDLAGEAERIRRAEARYLPTANQAVFDDCGKPVSQGGSPRPF